MFTTCEENLNLEETSVNAHLTPIRDVESMATKDNERRLS